MYPNWGFCSIWFILMKLACLVDWFGHFKLLSIKYNDLILSNYWISENGFSNFGVFAINSMLKPILWFWTKIELILTALKHASCVTNAQASYRIVISIFFCANLQSALGFLFSCLFLALFCLSHPFLSIMLRKTRAHRTSSSTPSPTFDHEGFLSEKNQEAYEKLNLKRKI